MRHFRFLTFYTDNALRAGAYEEAVAAGPGFGTGLIGQIWPIQEKIGKALRDRSGLGA
jgi:hypothetical protein